MTYNDLEQEIVEIFSEITSTKERISKVERCFEIACDAYYSSRSRMLYFKNRMNENLMVCSGLDKSSSKYIMLNTPFELTQMLNDRASLAENVADEDPNNKAVKHYLLTKDIILEDIELAKVKAYELEEQMDIDSDQYRYYLKKTKHFKKLMKQFQKAIRTENMYLKYLNFKRKIYSSYEQSLSNGRTR